VQAHLRHAERDARVNYHRMFPLPEPEPMEELEEFEEMEAPLTKEVR